MGFIQFNGDWRELAKDKRVKLYRWEGGVKGGWVFFDYGLEKFTDKYMDKGYMVEKEIKRDLI